MSIAEKMKARGYKPEASTDGEFKPLVGTYLTELITMRKEVDEKNGNVEYYQVEYKPKEQLEGDMFGEKFTFRKRVYLPDGSGTEEQNANAEAKLEKLINDMFTISGEDPDLSSDESLDAYLKSHVGKEAYVRSWGWKQDSGKELQMFVVQKASVAEKRRSSESVPL